MALGCARVVLYGRCALNVCPQAYAKRALCCFRDSLFVSGCCVVMFGPCFVVSCLHLSRSVLCIIFFWFVLEWVFVHSVFR